MFDLAIDRGVARLTLSRPGARNAVPIAEWPRLGARAREAVDKGARLIVVAGAGSAFCAGADIADFPRLHGDPAAAAGFRRAMREGIDSLAALPVPTLAAIHGPCFGAGVALALACDMRIASPAATFAITPAKFGIGYPQEDIRRLIERTGPGQTSRLLLSGLPVDAKEALRIGLVDILAPELDPEVARLTSALLAASAESQRVLKRGISLAAAGVGSDAAQDEAFDRLMASDALAARLAARRGGG